MLYNMAQNEDISIMHYVRCVGNTVIGSAQLDDDTVDGSTKKPSYDINPPSQSPPPLASSTSQQSGQMDARPMDALQSLYLPPPRLSGHVAPVFTTMDYTIQEEQGNTQEYCRLFTMGNWAG